MRAKNPICYGAIFMINPFALFTVPLHACGANEYLNFDVTRFPAFFHLTLYARMQKS